MVEITRLNEFLLWFWRPQQAADEQIKYDNEECSVGLLDEKRAVPGKGLAIKNQIVFLLIHCFLISVWVSASLLHTSKAVGTNIGLLPLEFRKYFSSGLYLYF